MNRSESTRGKWMALIAALLGWMFDGFEMGIIPVVAKPALIDLLDLSQQNGLALQGSTAQVRQEAKQRVDGPVGLWNGRITAAFLIGAALGGWGFGWLGDRLGRVRAMVFSVLTYAIFTGLCGLATGPWQLAALRFLAALGMGGEWSLGVALVMESWQPAARPILAGLIGAASNVGFMLAGVLVVGMEATGLKVADGGWRWVLGVCAFPALLTFFIRMFVPESEKWQEAVKVAPQARFAEIFAPSLRRRTIVAALLGGIALLGTWGSVQWISPWVLTMTNDQGSASKAQIFSAIGAIVGSFLGAVFAHRFSRRSTYCFLCLGSVIVCAFLFRYFDVSHDATEGRVRQPVQVGMPFYLTVALTGAFTASFYGWLPLYLPELFPTRLRATGQGFGYNFGRIIAAVGALTMGILISDVFGGSFAKAGATISLIYVVGLGVIWLAPETRGQPLPD